jgi:hypothetical protein|tara:strand:+ start:89493 stop:89870 length:378 start_codon:yes stop_codon:yes gene_type:complete
MSNSIQLKIYGAFFAAAAVVSGAYTHGTAEEETFTVKKMERTGGDKGKYLLWTTDNDVYQVADSWANLHFSASDVYGEIEKGKTYKADTYGWRFGVLSMYPNVVAVEPVAAEKAIDNTLNNKLNM